MRKKLLWTLLALGSASASASVDFYAREGFSYDAIVVKFSEEGINALQNNQLRRMADTRHLVVGEQHSAVRLSRVFDTAQSPRARRATDSNGLNRYYEIKLPQEKARDVAWINDIIERIERESDAEAIYPAILPEALDTGNSDSEQQSEKRALFSALPSGSAVPLLTDRQFYMKSPVELRPGYALGGINAFAAHRKYPASKGQGITVLSNEISRWNSDHINLSQPVFSVRDNKNNVGSHDTASVGIMAARDTGFGITGIASEADVAYSSSALVNLARAVDRLQPGDVVQVGIQVGTSLLPETACHNRCYVPMESQRAWFDVIKSATERGIHVIQAAGNGGVNLDHPNFNGMFNRQVRDSGSIIAAAVCGRDAKKPAFSDYGSRIDSAAWGCWDVVTTTDGDSGNNLLNGKNQQYTAMFSGTSAANPIIAGAAASVSAVAKERGLPLSPQQLRQLLTETGTQPASPLIGTQPDLIRALDTLTAAETVPKEKFTLSELTAAAVKQGHSTLHFRVQVEGELTLQAVVTDAQGQQKGSLQQLVKSGTASLSMALSGVSAGSHNLRYTAANRQGVEIAAGTVNFTLESAPEAANWDPKKTYASPCTRVSYQGKEWLNGWWTINNKPGSDGTWGVWRVKGAGNMHGSCK